jgi:hypothetical protein
MATGFEVPQVTHADVVRVVARDFPQTAALEVLSLLRQFQNLVQPEATDDQNARFHLAILKLAEGQLDRISELVSVANLDFRDVISYAEYPAFMANGAFVGADRLNEKERKQLIQRDWDQYHEWFHRT